jgi:hypothetical protein
MDHRIVRPRLLIDDQHDVEDVAEDIADGAIVATAFANFYVLVARPQVETVRRINVLTGRPVGQVGSVTTSFDLIPTLFDWSALPSGVSGHAVRALMDELFALGPFGFRGPAAEHVPTHLTLASAGVRTVQVIAPGYACPSNVLFAHAVDTLGSDLLSVGSASRPDTGRVAWRADDIVAELREGGEFELIEHRDEAASLAAYPHHTPGPVTILSFHALDGFDDGRPVLTIDRHGSLPVEHVRELAEPLGFEIRSSDSARDDLLARPLPIPA